MRGLGDENTCVGMKEGVYMINFGGEMVGEEWSNGQPPHDPLWGGGEPGFTQNMNGTIKYQNLKK